jgi:hypothetical protein
MSPDPADPESSVRQLDQAIKELEIAKAFLHESGTDPEAWIDGVLDRLRALARVAASAPQQDQFKENGMDDRARLALCNDGDVSDYGESLTVLPDSLGRPLAARIRLLMERADREAHLAVLLR